MCVLLAKSMRVNLVKPIAANNLVVDVDSSIHCRCFTGSWSINDMTLVASIYLIVISVIYIIIMFLILYHFQSIYILM